MSWGTQFGNMDHRRGHWYVERDSQERGSTWSVYRVESRNRQGFGVARLRARFANRRDAIRYVVDKNTRKP